MFLEKLHGCDNHHHSNLNCDCVNYNNCHNNKPTTLEHKWADNLDPFIKSKSTFLYISSQNCGFEFHSLPA